MQLENLPDGCPNTWIDVSETYPVKIEALRIHGRHVLDAREMAERLEQNPQLVVPLHRAWPDVLPDEKVTDL